MSSKVFISWGGDLSKKLAEEVRKWLPSVIQSVVPYFTPDDIDKGKRWESDITNELMLSDIGIICLTKDNIDRPWILFEAGALSKKFGKSNVCTILFDVESTEITGPLTSFQATKFEKDDFYKLLKTVNETLGEDKLKSEILRDVFEMWWPQLETKIKLILSTHKDGSKKKQRTERDILEEILELTRRNSLQSPTSRRRHSMSTQEIFHLLSRDIDVLCHYNLELENEEMSHRTRRIQRHVYELARELGYEVPDRRKNPFSHGPIIPCSISELEQ